MAQWRLRDLFRSKAETAWERYVPMSQQEAQEVLLRDMPSGTSVDLEIEPNGTGSIAIRKSGIIDESRSFDLRRHLLNSGSLYINDEAYKGHGIGRHIMRNEIEFFRACGVKRFDIYAASTNGGYTWARLGFLPDKPAELQDEVEDKYEMLKPLLTPEEIAELKGPLRFRKEKDVWRVADMRANLTPRLCKLFEDAAAGDRNAIDTRNRISTGYYRILSDIENDKALPLGRLLLTGTSWYAHINFDDTDQMVRVENYVGGWKGVPEHAPVNQSFIERLRFW